MERITAYKAQERALEAGLRVADAVIKDAHEQVEMFGVIDYHVLSDIANRLWKEENRKSGCFCLFCNAAHRVERIEQCDIKDMRHCCPLDGFFYHNTCTTWSRFQSMDYVYAMKMKLLNAQYTLRKTGRWI